MYRSNEDEARVGAATKAAREAGRRRLTFLGIVGQAVQGFRPAREAGDQGIEGQPQVLMVVHGPESWVGKGNNRHRVAGRASYVLRPDGSRVFVPGKLANASGGDIPLNKLRAEDGVLAVAAQRAVVADKREKAKRWRGNPHPKVK